MRANGLHPSSLHHRQTVHHDLVDRAVALGAVHPADEHWSEDGTHVGGVNEGRDRNAALPPSLLEALPGAWARSAAARRGDGGAGTRQPTVEEIVHRFGLEPHPEGGFYSETYRASEAVACVRTVDGVTAKIAQRQASTAIYFLLTPGNVSRFHRIAADEVWHFYLGSEMTVVVRSSVLFFVLLYD